MNKVNNITKKLDSIFKQVRNFEKEEYEKILFNIELLKKKHYMKKFKKTETRLFENKSFKNLIDNI
mgnify:CR=1 FL=1